MTQLDLLVTNVAELLATAVHEVLRLMGQAVSEYQEESARMCQENQKLQHKLEELQKRLDTADAVQQVSSSGASEESSVETQHRQILDCRLKQGPLLSEEEEAGTEPQNLSFKEEKPSSVQLESEDWDVHNTWDSKPKSPTSNLSHKNRWSSSRLRRTTPASPNITAAAETSEFETQGGISNNIKMESNPEAPDCAVAGQSENMFVNSAVFNSLENTTLEDGQNQQPCSPGLSEPAYILQDQHASLHSHVLSSRVENVFDIPSLSHLNMRREGPHACHLCGKTFATSSSLGAHFVCHSNERPFACKCCNFRFSRLADLKKHERIHTGEQPYNCSLCGRKFNRTENLRRHLRKVHHGAML